MRQSAGKKPSRRSLPKASPLPSGVRTMVYAAGTGSGKTESMLANIVMFFKNFDVMRHGFR